uniref:hypothetical protein n=1 Tax=Paractinoplanes polyasparticus TaxID=2856853 RepID=UPI001C84CE99|nr:hypothetical protein [Actinoplanes polyasparticus]
MTRGAINVRSRWDIPPQYAELHLAVLDIDDLGDWPCPVCDKPKKTHRWFMTVDDIEQDCSEATA